MLQFTKRIEATLCSINVDSTTKDLRKLAIIHETDNFIEKKYRKLQ